MGTTGLKPSVNTFNITASEMLNLSIKRSFSSQRSGENTPRHVRNNLSSSSDEPKKASTLKEIQTEGDMKERIQVFLPSVIKLHRQKRYGSFLVFIESESIIIRL